MKIHSIRFKITAITVAVILAVFLSVITICYSVIKKETDTRSVEMMRTVGQEAKNTLNEYFISIERSVDMTANEAIDSLDSVVLVECGAAGAYASQHERTSGQSERLDTYLAGHCAKIQKTFETMASHTQGVITYYYCINPEVSENEHGFFYSRVGKAGFVEREPLDARELDPADIEHTTWYYTPIERGRPSWVGPYTAHFLDEMWIYSYVVPIYSAGQLIGVLGMDISLDMLIDQVKPIRIYQTGFVSLCTIDSEVIYHPELPQGSVPQLTGITAPREVLHEEDSGSTLIRYTSNGVQRQMCFFTLNNGMKLVLVAPVREINSSWMRMIRIVLLVTAVVVVIYAVVLMFAMGLLTLPLRRLTAASRRLANADYDVSLTYKSRDEVGELTEAFRQMRDKLKEYIEDLNRRVNTDDLTGLPNLRGFFQIAQSDYVAIKAQGKSPIMMYINLIGLKHFNRQFGFEEGNRLIMAVAEILERHYGSEFVCRVGQDHFAVSAAAEGAEDELRQVFEECQSANGGRSLPMRVGLYHSDLGVEGTSVSIDRAKFACDTRRSTAVSGFTWYDLEMQNRARNARYITTHLDQALSEKRIEVYYQPLMRSINLKVCDEEALARWNDPERGMLSPADFIPVLEDAGLIYKLDLYVLDEVLSKIKLMRSLNLPTAPQSINLSRSDFDACDIVEEIRARVDASGVERKMITIEITESVIGRDFDFIGRQIKRFQSLGFPVWMDDFGSGYSSLDVLQSIKFDLLKFDMSFMRKLNEGESGKIILTKLMEMATAIGVDTVCEGVETAEQVHFLQEIGCSKLQGYYFSKPCPLSRLLEQYRDKTIPIRFGFENPEDAEYYEAVSRVNLLDLGVLASEESAFRHAFNTLPMGVIEIRKDTSRFMRSNQSYRDFIQRYYKIDLSTLGSEFMKYTDAFVETVAKTCCEQGGRLLYDEKMPDGSTVHSFARRIAVNPVTGDVAVAVAVLSIAEPDESTSYADIARALAADYYNIYVVDLDTEKFIEYSSTVGGEELAVERHGKKFFDSVRKASVKRIYEEDRELFLSRVTRENIIRELSAQGAFTTTYRLIDTGEPVYASMKVTRMPGGNRIIIGISIVDAQMKQQERMEELHKERDALSRLMALSNEYFSLFSIDPKTGRYIEYASTDAYEDYGFNKEGEDFFADSLVNIPKAIYPEDLPEFRRQFSKENILNAIQKDGVFQMSYRLVFYGVPTPVCLRISSVREGEGEKLVAGVMLKK